MFSTATIIYTVSLISGAYIPLKSYFDVSGYITSSSHGSLLESHSSTTVQKQISIIHSSGRNKLKISQVPSSGLSPCLTPCLTMCTTAILETSWTVDIVFHVQGVCFTTIISATELTQSTQPHCFHLTFTKHGQIKRYSETSKFWTEKVYDLPIFGILRKQFCCITFDNFDGIGSSTIDIVRQVSKSRCALL